MISIAHVLDRCLSLIIPITAVISTILLAKATSHGLEAFILPPPVLTDSLSPSKQNTDGHNQSKNGAALLTRNMFCIGSAIDCATPHRGAPTAIANATAPVPLTNVPLRLIATHITSKPDHSFASIVNTKTNSQGSYWFGKNIPNVGPIKEIRSHIVVFHNVATDRDERINLEPLSPASLLVNSTTEPVDLKVENAIQQLKTNTWKVERSLLTSLINNHNQFPDIRIRPELKHGRIIGFRINRLSSNSILEQIGLQRNDVIRAVNGKLLTSPEVILGMFYDLKTLNRMTVELKRQGEELKLHYHLY